LPKILFVFGTRPEAVKLCPVLLYLRTHFPEWDIQCCVTAQHRHLLDQVLTLFGVVPEYDLDSMTAGQTLFASTGRIVSGLERVLAEAQPDLVVVQGDTTTTFCGALAAFYARVAVAHVEAGMRTGDLDNPFPEELNRVLTSKLARVHFAATEWAAGNLRQEGVPAGAICVTGNTGIDAAFFVRDQLSSGRVEASVPAFAGERMALVTAHRRESFGAGLEGICRAVARIGALAGVQVVFSVHPNPNVQDTVRRILGSEPNVRLVESMIYTDFIASLLRSYIVLTDSGGVLEEASSFGKPVLVMRDKTERPEAVQAGTARLVGTDEEQIFSECRRLLSDKGAYDSMAHVQNPYGDGRASERIAEFLTRHIFQ
jgi:UDP-N-acetylglucosamine 2-epimerase (non-hydrolysing)